MKKIIYLLGILLISSSAFSQKMDFSGTWKLNKEKSELGEQYSMAPVSIELQMQANLLTESRELNFQGESFTTTDKFTLDGKECENPGWMDSVKKSTANWSADKTSLTIITRIPMQDGGELTITSAYSMKGANLVISTTAASSFGEFTEVQVFDKK